MMIPAAGKVFFPEPADPFRKILIGCAGIDIVPVNRNITQVIQHFLAFKPVHPGKLFPALFIKMPVEQAGYVAVSFHILSES